MPALHTHHGPGLSYSRAGVQGSCTTGQVMGLHLQHAACICLLGKQRHHLCPAVLANREQGSGVQEEAR
jgi:hypothetical protein